MDVLSGSSKASLVEHRCKLFFSKHASYDRTPCIRDVPESDKCFRGGSFSDVFVSKLHDSCSRHSSNCEDDCWPTVMRCCGVSCGLVAVKRFRTHVDHRNAEKVYKMIAREFSVWISLEHKNIVPLLGFTWSERQPALVMPWMNHGTIDEYAASHSSSMSDKARMILGIADGLAYLHAYDKQIVHSDLKCANILASYRGDPLLTDFGVSRILVESGTLSNSSSNYGSIRWMAPELLGDVDYDYRNSPSREDEFSNKETDVWSFGMTALELLSHEKPYATHSKDASVIRTIARYGLPERPACTLVNARASQFAEAQLCDNLWRICRICWRRPSERPEAMWLKALLQPFEAPVPCYGCFREKLSFYLRMEHCDTAQINATGCHLHVREVPQKPPPCLLCVREGVECDRNNISPKVCSNCSRWGMKQCPSTAMSAIPTAVVAATGNDEDDDGGGDLSSPILFPDETPTKDEWGCPPKRGFPILNNAPQPLPTRDSFEEALLDGLSTEDVDIDEFGMTPGFDQSIGYTKSSPGLIGVMQVKAESDPAEYGGRRRRDAMEDPWHKEYMQFLSF